MSGFKTVRLNDENRRILVTSDIHGHIDHLVNLLNKADFGENDLLVVVGDMVEKGPDSLAVVRYLMRLCATGRAIVLMGNVDNRFLWQLDNITDLRSAEQFLEYLCYMREWKGTSLFDEMCAEIGEIPKTSDDVHNMLEKVKFHFEPELEFIRGLPTMLETSKFIFIHGGIYESENAFISIPDEEKDRHKCLKFDSFLDFAHKNNLEFDRYVIVGHWPVVNNNRSMRIMNPHFDNDLRVISIDGGCGVNRDGQLNLLILPFCNCDIHNISCIYFDGFPTCIASNEQSPSQNPINICWGDNKVCLLALDETSAEVEHISSGNRFWLPIDYVQNIDRLSIGDITDTASCTDHRLKVSAGDEISVIRKTSHGILAKKNGTVGWYYGETVFSSPS